MIPLEVWLDKLPEDKVKYYNRTRMSMELFARKLRTSPQRVIDGLKRDGYSYSTESRLFEKIPPKPGLRKVQRD